MLRSWNVRLPAFGAAAALCAASLWTTAAEAQSAPPALQPVRPGLVYLERQAETQRMATSYIGKNVYGVDGQRIGDINDVVVDPQAGTAPAVVVGVGGLLGLGEKDVAVPLDALRVEMRDGKPHLTLSASKDDLRKAPAFVRLNPGM